jgi:hypothetical protein
MIASRTIIPPLRLRRSSACALHARMSFRCLGVLFALLFTACIGPGTANAALVVTSGTATSDEYNGCKELPCVGLPGDYYLRSHEVFSLPSTPHGNTGDGWGNITWDIWSTRLRAIATSAEGCHPGVSCMLPSGSWSGRWWGRRAFAYTVTFTLTQCSSYVATASGNISGISTGSGVMAAGTYTISGFTFGYNPSAFAFDVTFAPASCGSCCASDGSCTLTQQAACAAPSVWHSGWATCEPNPCPQLRACCDAATGACTLVLQAACAAPSNWHGEWASCEPNPCPQPRACCDPGTGACTLTLEAACAAPSVWNEGWTTCDPNPCARPCCSAAGDCTLTDQAGCPVPSVWHGDWVSCEPTNPCPPACVPVSPGCPRSKVLLVWGKPNPGESMLKWQEASWRLLARAEYELGQLGWQGEFRDISSPTTIEDLQDYVRHDRCIRGLWIVSHGGPGSVIQLARRSSDLPALLTPAALAVALPTGQVGMVGVIACHAEEAMWSGAFGNAPIVTAANPLAGGLVDLTAEWTMAPWSPNYPVACGEKRRMAAPTIAPSGLPPCYGFAVIDTSGGEGYEALSCAARSGLPEGGEFLLSDSLGTFVVRSLWDPSYADSVGCSGTLLARSPHEEVEGAWMPAGRALVFSALAKDTLITSLGASVAIHYSGEDLHERGIAEESVTLFHLAGNDTSFQSIASVVDTLTHSVSGFVEGPIGIVGVYGRLFAVTAACCAPVGTCTVTTEAGCSPPNAWHSDWASCEPTNPCPQPTGACCAAAGTCLVTTQASCTGNWTEAGVCVPNPCVPAPGACCFRNAFCRILAPARCLALRGVFVGSVCTPSTNPPCYVMGGSKGNGSLPDSSVGDPRSGAFALSVETVPNPGSGQCRVRFSLDRGTAVTVEVFDLAGARVRVLATGPRSAGQQTIAWDGQGDDGRTLPSGVYFVRVTTAQQSTSGRVVLTR